MKVVHFTLWVPAAGLDDADIILGQKRLESFPHDLNKIIMEKVIDRLVGKLDKVLKEDRKNNPCETYLRGAFFYGRHSVMYSFRESGLVVEIYNPELNLYLDNVANHCERCAVRWDDVEIEKTDIWNEHGFASSSDYVQYRFG